MAKKTEISPSIERIDGQDYYVLYHGTPCQERFGAFKTPTGVEVMDVTKGGVVYLSSDISVARKYAGKNGYVYKVLTKKLTSYEDQRNKQGLPAKARKYLRNVYVSLPKDLVIADAFKA